MSVVLISVLGLLAVLVPLLGYAATRPDMFRVQRSAVIKAPAWKVFTLIEDLRAFNSWNPYERKDPGLKGTYSGTARGVGAAYAWDGRKVGAGRMEITACQAPSSVTMQVDFVRPFKARNTAEFTLRAEGDTLTIVTWAMHGPAPYLSKLMGVVFGVEGAIGKDFEAGLANLRALTERR
jgi:hypothetical protein